jgi:hypothetical protein
MIDGWESLGKNKKHPKYVLLASPPLPSWICRKVHFVLVNTEPKKKKKKGKKTFSQIQNIFTQKTTSIGL